MDDCDLCCSERPDVGPWEEIPTGAKVLRMRRPGTPAPAEARAPPAPDPIASTPRLDVWRVFACIVGATALVLAAVWVSLAGSGWDPEACGSPWHQPSCELDSLLVGQGSRASRINVSSGEVLGVLVLHGTPSNFLSVVRGVAGAGVAMDATMVADLFSPGQGHAKWRLGPGRYNLDGFCQEAQRRHDLVSASLGGSGDVVDPHSLGMVCAGYGSELWGAVDADRRSLLLESGYGRYPHTPSFVGSPSAFYGWDGPLLVISIGMPLSHEAVSWVLSVASRSRSRGQVRVVFAGHATRSEVNAALSMGCDSLWSPSGVSEVSGSLVCTSPNGQGSMGRGFFVLAFQSGLDPPGVARACSGALSDSGQA